VFAPVRRRSGREVTDGDVLLTHTPLPLRAPAGTPRTHYWAVEWQAVDPAADALEDRAGLPAGRYRFHVEGMGWTLDSRPFDVGPATMVVSATRVGTELRTTVGYESREGFRLIDASGRQNRRVPLRRGPVRLTFELDVGAPREETVMTVGADGLVTVDLGMFAARVRRVTARDRFDNAGRAAVP
jgi:hypothetical protein